MTRYSRLIILLALSLIALQFDATAQLTEFSTTVEGGRGLMHMQSARTFGKGAVVVGLKGFVMKKELMITEPWGKQSKKMDFPAVFGIPVTFGLTDEIDLTAAFYGIHDGRGREYIGEGKMGYGDPETGLGASRFSVKIRLPLPHKSRIQFAGKIGAILDTSVEQLDGMNYRWSRKGTDIEASLYESIDISSFMSLHLEQGYVLSGTDYYDDQAVGAAGISIQANPWWIINCEINNRTFFGTGPQSVIEAGDDPSQYYSSNGVPAVGYPEYVIDTASDYRKDYLIITPSMVFQLNQYLALDLGAHINIAEQTDPKETFQFVFGFTFATKIKAMIDSDGDGIKNNIDIESKTPKGFPVDSRGQALDTDMDGVPDGADREPGTPLGASINEYGVGIDSDNDGVFDGLDMEPNTIYGCPVDKFGVALDDDRDGVPNGRDKEPDTIVGAVVDNNGVALDDDGDTVPNGLDLEPETVRGAIVDNDGVALDEDIDGVPDGIDQEVNTPKGLLVDNNGRALIKQEFSLLREGVIRLNTIYYTGGTADIPEEANYILDEIGRIMRKYPLLKIQIGGHTDSTGDPAINMKLARDRARKILEVILSRYPDINKDRFRVVGFGSEKPIASNRTFEGRRTNRRVEFVIID